MFFSAAAPDLINELEPLSAAIAILDPAGRAALLDDPRMLRPSRFAASARRVKRYVAIKPTGAGMDPRQLLARFDAERQARALMDLANITGLLDGGLHE